LVECVLKQLVAFSFNFSFFFPLLKEAKSTANIPIRAFYLLKSDFFNLVCIPRFQISSVNNTEVCSIRGRYIRVKKLTLLTRSALLISIMPEETANNATLQQLNHKVHFDNS